MEGDQLKVIRNLMSFRVSSCTKSPARDNIFTSNNQNIIKRLHRENSLPWALLTHDTFTDSSYIGLIKVLRNYQQTASPFWLIFQYY